jgi:DeoR/GlpR family transcriptional regulator of sugar metabolism
MSDNRLDAIDKIVQGRGEISVAELTTLFSDVSAMTIRRDLERLESTGRLVRVHGGAKSIRHIGAIAEEKYTERSPLRVQQKREIAQKALRFMRPNASVYLDSGSTVMLLASMLPDERIFITTGGVNIALELTKNSRNNITILGGAVHNDSLAVASASAARQIARTNIDTAFMGATGFGIAAGFTNANEHECALKTAVIRRAGKVVMLLDSGKIDNVLPYTFASAQDIDVLITDGGIDPDMRRYFEGVGVEVI